MVSSDDKLFGPGRLRSFSPYLAPGERQKLHNLLNIGAGLPPTFIDELRALARRYVDDGDSLKLRTICLLVADLCEQGWRGAVESDQITFEPPGISRGGEHSVDDIKDRLLSVLQNARLRQLREPSVRRFIGKMERLTIRSGGKTSVTDLIDDGAALAREFRALESLPPAEQEAALTRIVDPVVEVCETGAKCADTGLPLINIWRYFRHTWAHE